MSSDLTHLFRFFQSGTQLVIILKDEGIPDQYTGKSKSLLRGDVLLFGVTDSSILLFIFFFFFIFCFFLLYERVCVCSLYTNHCNHCTKLHCLITLLLWAL